MQSKVPKAAIAYSGAKNLEVMDEARNYNEYLERRVREVLIDSSEPTLDFGAGMGTFSRRMKARGYRVVCVEPDSGQAASLAKAGFEVKANARELEEGRFGQIYTLNVLEHIEDDRTALRELRRVAKPGARLYIYVPAFGVLFSSLDRRVGHVRRYGMRELVEKAGQAGFEVLSARFVDSMGFPASLALKAFGNDSGDLNLKAVRFYDRYCFPISRRLDSLLGAWVGKNIELVAIAK